MKEFTWRVQRRNAAGQSSYEVLECTSFPIPFRITAEQSYFPEDVWNAPYLYTVEISNDDQEVTLGHSTSMNHAKSLALRTFWERMNLMAKRVREACGEFEDEPIVF